MPHISVSMFPGRDDETKQDIAEKLQKFYVETFGTDEEAVSVSICRNSRRRVSGNHPTALPA